VSALGLQRPVLRSACRRPAAYMYSIDTLTAWSAQGN
jgi:hypothetical protein